MDGDDNRRSLLTSSIVITSYPRPRAASRVNNKPAHKLLPRREHSTTSSVECAMQILPPTLHHPPHSQVENRTNRCAAKGWPQRELLRASKALLLTIPSLLETDGGENIHLSRRKYIEDTPAAKHGFQRARTMK